jgi:DNA-binding transcriptional LysR family regulator
LDDIKAFVEVAETGDFGRAARRLELSKSIVSRRIARLEDALGTRLLSRTTRGIALTKAGYAFKIPGEGSSWTSRRRAMPLPSTETR